MVVDIKAFIQKTLDQQSARLVERNHIKAPDYVSVEKNPRWAWKDGYKKALADVEREMDLLSGENPTVSYMKLLKIALTSLLGKERPYSDILE